MAESKKLNKIEDHECETEDRFEWVKNERLRHYLVNWNKFEKETQDEAVDFILKDWLDEESLIEGVIDLLSPLERILTDNKTLRRQLDSFGSVDFQYLVFKWLNLNWDETMLDYHDKGFETDYVNDKNIGFLEDYLKETLARKIIDEIKGLIKETEKTRDERIVW